jgi:hypothetical protein
MTLKAPQLTQVTPVLTGGGEALRISSMSAMS